MKKSKSSLVLALVGALFVSLMTHGQPSLAASFAPAAPHAFVATAVSATITYDENDSSGTTVDQTYDAGSTSALDFANPWSRSGYAFLGWSTDPAASVADSSYSVTSDATLYAIWVVQVTITFDANDGSGNTQDQAFNQGASNAINQPKIWSRNGYTFVGWSVDAAAVSPDSFFTVASPATLYAVWQQNPAGTFTITFNKNDGSGTSQDVPFTSGDRTALSTDNPFSRDGYTFLGWATADTATAPSTSFNVTADANLYAVWSINSYFVTYDANDGSGNTQFQSLNFADTNALSFANPFTRSPYDFLGWSTDPAATSPDSGLTVTADVTVYAVWFLASYTISYDANDGSGFVQTEQFNKGYTAALNEPKISTRSGYSFSGWSTKSTATAADKTYTVSADATLYAVWKKNPAGSVTITYSANDGTADSVDATVVIGNTKALTRANTFTYVGHKFLGWSVDANTDTPDKTYTVSTDATLFAVWGLNTYTITYSANDGSSNTATQTYLFGDTNVFDFANTFDRTGYTFAGWAADQNATEPDTSFTVTGDSKVYAIWTVNSYTVTYDVNDGSGNGDSQFLNFGDRTALNFVTNYSIDGSSFLGWSDDPNATTPLKIFTVNGDVTLYAVWHQYTSQIFTITYHSNDGNDLTDPVDYNDGDPNALDYSSSWTRDGYNFLGWSADPHAAVQDFLYVVTGASDLYAVWQQITHTVTYDANNNSGKTETEVVADGTANSLDHLTTWVRTGYSLLGWSLDPTAKVADTDYQVYDDVTLFAVWHRISSAKFHVTYHSADGNALSKVVDYTDGSAAALATTNTWARNGYKFLGWSSNYGASVPDARFVVTADSDLFALWAEADPAILGAFPNRTKSITAKTYKMVAPTSNSGGAVSYSLDCPDVATLRGTTVTLVGVGTCEITVLVAAKPNFGEATAVMTLTITPEVKAIKVSPPKNGDAIVTDDGDDVINLVRNNDAAGGKVSYVSDDPYTPANRWTLDILSISGKAKPVALDANNFMSFENVGKVGVNATGYMPGTTLNVYIGTILLGTATTDDQGAFVGSYSLPKTVKLGAQYVQVNGISNSDTIRSISQAVNITLPTFTVAKSVAFVGTASKLNAAAGKILAALGKTLKGKKNIVVSISAWVKPAANIKADVKLAAARAAAIITALKKTYKVTGKFTYTGYAASPANKPKLPRLDLVITYN